MFQHDVMGLAGEQVKVLVREAVGSLQTEMYSVGIAVGSDVKF